MVQVFRYYAESHLGQRGKPSSAVGRLLSIHDGQLDVSLNFLSVSDCAAIGTVLQSHPKAERITWVNFSMCRMTDSGLAQLLPGLQRCKSIGMFNVLGNSLSSQHMSAMSNILANNASTLSALSLGQNRIGDDGLDHLLERLKQCRGLKMLSLCMNGLTTRSDATLSDVLSGLSSLEDLVVSVLGDDSMEQLAHGMQTCKRLKCLYVMPARLSTRSVPVLHRLLSSIPSLTLQAFENDFSEDAKKELYRRVSSHRIKMF